MMNISNADQAASISLAMSMQAADQGTFAVGGLIVNNKTGEIIHQMHNNVVKPLPHGKGFTWDPTAHGERQLVYWYYENRQALNLPPAHELTVVTSLDPCVMCTGALLAAGFNVGVVAIDDYAGINYNASFDFYTLPAGLRALAKAKFGYYASGNPETDPASYVREYEGGPNVAFCKDRVSAVNRMACDAIFAESSTVVRSISSTESGKDPTELKNPAMLPDDSPIKQAYRAVYPKAFTLTTDNPRIPGAQILAELRAVADAGTEGDGNAVGFLDPFGNLVLCLPGRERVAPVRTPFMEVTQAYAQIRWNLMCSDARRATVDHLTVPKYGTFVFLHAPDPNTATGIMTLGAYGSTMEGPIPQSFPTNLQYAHAPHSGTLLELTEVIGDLPPLYSQFVQIAIGQSPAAIEESEPSAIGPAPTAVVHEPGFTNQARAKRAHDHLDARHRSVYVHKSRNSRR